MNEIAIFLIGMLLGIIFELVIDVIIMKIDGK